MSLHTEIIAAKAAAEQQTALNREVLAELTERARVLLDRYDATEVWALLGRDVARQLNCTTKHQQFAVEMLVVAVIDIVQRGGVE